MDRRITRTSYHNMVHLADTWDVWPLDDGTGFMLVLFRNGFSSVISTIDGPYVWTDEQSAVNYLLGHRPDLPRTRCDPGPR